MIVAQPKELIAAFVQSYGGGGPFRFFSALALIRHNEIVCGLIYQQRTPCSIDIHMASIPGCHWGNRELLYAAFDYPFNQLRMRRITALIPAKNTRSRRLAEHLGFKMEGIMRHAYADDDMSVYGLLKEDCRWLGQDSARRLRLAA